LLCSTIPLFEYKGKCDAQIKWATKKGESGWREFWGEENQQSIDGFPTNILEKS